MGSITYVQGAERMITAADLRPDGLLVRFADGLEGVIPLAELQLGETPIRVSIPDPHAINLHLSEDRVQELPWDFARHFVDGEHRGRSEEAGARGRRAFGQRLRELRSRRGITQSDLAERAGVNRVTVARIEGGQQLPRYRTVLALARGLDRPVEDLIAGSQGPGDEPPEP